MAALIKCDKCGGIAILPCDFKVVRAFSQGGLLSELQDSLSKNAIDVCNDCYKEIFNIKEDK